MRPPGPAGTMAATMRASFAEVAANRASFGVQMGVMVANDIIWLVFWGFYFRVHRS